MGLKITSIMMVLILKIAREEFLVKKLMLVSKKLEIHLTKVKNFIMHIYTIWIQKNLRNALSSINFFFRKSSLLLKLK